MWVLVVSKALDSDDMLSIDRAEWGQAAIDVQMSNVLGRFIIRRYQNCAGSYSRFSTKANGQWQCESAQG